MALPPINSADLKRDISSSGFDVPPLTTVVHGTERDDVIDGNNETPEVINGYGGKDKLTGGAYDTINAGDGDDVITLNGGAIGFGEGGNDRFTINKGTGYGGVGNDIFNVRNGTAYGEAGNDSFSSYDAGDPNATITLNGGEGDDMFYGNGKTKTIADGGAGNDTFNYYDIEGQLQTGNGRVTINGGDGNDKIKATYGDIDGGAGYDEILVWKDSNVTGGAGFDIMEGYKNNTFKFNTLDEIQGDEIRVTGDGNMIDLSGILASNPGFTAFSWADPAAGFSGVPGQIMLEEVPFSGDWGADGNTKVYVLSIDSDGDGVGDKQITIKANNTEDNWDNIIDQSNFKLA